MNKRGSFFDVILIIVVMFVTVLFFVGFSYGFGLLTSSVTNINSNIPGVNITETSNNTFGKINNGLPTLRWISLAIFVAMIISIMVSNFLVKTHPVFFILYILIVVVAILFSVPVSNAYEGILNSNSPLVSTLNGYSAMNFIFLNLPIFITIIGIMGAIFLFLGIIYDSQQGGSITI